MGGVFGANTTSFGTVQKFGVNTPTTADNTASAIIATGGTGNKGLLVQGVASQSANLVEYQNNSGTVLGGIGSAGQIFSGTTAPVSNNQAAIVAGASTRSGLIVRGAASQTADLFQLQDSSANVLSEFNASGYLGIGTTTASNKLTINTAATADSAAQALISTGGTGNQLRHSGSCQPERKCV